MLPVEDTQGSKQDAVHDVGCLYCLLGVVS